MATSGSDPLAVRLTRYIPHIPTPKQHAFLWLNCQEALYGGAAGGGKSDALLMAALQYVDVEGYSAILFRRTFPDLNQPGALIPRSKEWLAGTDARWNDNEHRWTFPSGATLTFGHLVHEDAKLHYQGAEFDFVGFDELTQFSETQYRYLFSRVRRRQGSGVPGRMRAASNPGGPGHRWVQQRLLEKKPDEFAEDEDAAAAEARARVFIPAGLDDNPHLDRGEYRRALQALDPQTRKQLLDGDWNAREQGNWVYDGEGLDAAFALGAKYDLAPPRERPGGPVALGIDWGVHSHVLFARPTAGGGFYIFDEVADDSADLEQVTAKVVAKARLLDSRVEVEHFDAAEPILHKSFRRQFADAMGYSPKWVGVPFNKYKKLAIQYGQVLMRRTAEHADMRTMAISEAGCPELARQLRSYPWKDVDAGKTEKTDDHGPDAMAALVAKLAESYFKSLSAKRTAAKRR